MYTMTHSDLTNRGKFFWGLGLSVGGLVLGAGYSGKRWVYKPHALVGLLVVACWIYLYLHGFWIAAVGSCLATKAGMLQITVSAPIFIELL